LDHAKGGNSAVAEDRILDRGVYATAGHLRFDPPLHAELLTVQHRLPTAPVARLGGEVAVAVEYQGGIDVGRNRGGVAVSGELDEHPVGADQLGLGPGSGRRGRYGRRRSRCGTVPHHNLIIGRTTGRQRPQQRH
jgi:hypothetical protein